MATSRIENPSTTSVQLSLFSEMTIAELGDNLIEESIDDRNDYTHTTGTQDPGTLEPPSAEDGRATVCNTTDLGKCSVSVRVPRQYLQAAPSQELISTFDGGRPRFVAMLISGLSLWPFTAVLPCCVSPCPGIETS
jgi:hypothetical protein